ncbi:MAG: hypothetical protein PF501_10285 [Salinisphaera sp.]|jgi:hypothetical protein|nr:hypothetical protein [Salinisphaera sp.]
MKRPLAGTHSVPAFSFSQPFRMSDYSGVMQNPSSLASALLFTRAQGLLRPASVFLLFLALVVPSMPASAASGSDQAPARPIYLDIVPIGGTAQSAMPPQSVAAMARESLGGAGLTIIRRDGQPLPAGVRVLRILYIVHEQSTTTSTTLSASASTDLLRTRADSQGHVLVDSLYSGLQQTLVQGADEMAARQNLRSHFKQELHRRIASALTARETQQ